MKTTVKKPNWIVRWWNDLICAPPPRDPAYHTNEEMLEIIERHHRLLLEAAKNAGLDIGDEYDAAQGRSDRSVIAG